MNTEHTNATEKTSLDVKPADALGRLSERSRASRLSLVVVAVVGMIVIAFIGGALFRTITNGSNTPEVPKVEI